MLPLTANPFRTDVLSCTETYGIISHLVTKTRVTGVPVTPLSEQSALWNALNAAALAAGGAPFTPGAIPDGNGFESLILIKRQADIVEGDATTFDVTLEYDLFINNQELNEPEGLNSDSKIYGRMRSSVQQKPTNFYTDYTLTATAFTIATSTPALPTLPATFQITTVSGTTTAVLGLNSYVLTFTGGVPPNGTWTIPGIGTTTWAPAKQQIFVQHTFPTQYKGNAPNTVYTQGGEIQVQYPAANFQFEGFLNTTMPGAFRDLIHGMVNSITFLGKSPRTWLCAEVGYHCVGLAVPIGGGMKVPRYKFNFEMLYNPDTWDNTVVFIDATTGKPPANLVPGVGTKIIPYLPSVNFNDMFSASFEE